MNDLAHLRNVKTRRRTYAQGYFVTYTLQFWIISLIKMKFRGWLYFTLDSIAFIERLLMYNFGLTLHCAYCGNATFMNRLNLVNLHLYFSILNV